MPFSDPYVRENRAYNSTPNDDSTYDITADSRKGNSPHICRQNMLNTQNNAQMCDKSTITDPVHIINAKEIILAVDRGISSKDATVGIVPENMSPIKVISIRRSSLLPSEVNTSPVPLKENNLTTEENNSLKENLLRTDKYTFLQNNEERHIQSIWFESSFEMEHFLNEKLEASQKSEIGAIRDTFVSRSTDKEYKHKSYCRKTQSHEAETSSAPQTSTTIKEQNLTGDSTTVPAENMSGNGKLGNANEALSKSKTVTLPETTVSLPEATVALPEATITLPEATVTLPKSTVTLPEDTVTFPEANYSHKIITNLFETYKEIHNAENNPKSLNILHSAQNNNSRNKKLPPSMNDLKTATKCNKNSSKKTNCKESYQNSTEVFQQSNKSFKPIDLISKSSQNRSNFEDLLNKNVKSKGGMSSKKWSNNKSRKNSKKDRSYKEMISQKYSSSLLDGEKAISHMNDLVKESMDKYGESLSTKEY